MTVGRIIYTCPNCTSRFGWFEMQRMTRMGAEFFCPGCGCMRDLDGMEVYDGNDDN